MKDNYVMVISNIFPSYNELARHQTKTSCDKFNITEVTQF